MTTNSSGFAPVGVLVDPPTLPAPEVVGMKPGDEYVPADLIANGFMVELKELWDNAAQIGDKDYITFVWAPEGAAAYRFQTTELPGPVSLPIFVKVLPSFLHKNERVRMYYEVRSAIPDSQVFEYSSSIFLNLDTISPGTGTDMSPAESVIDPITKTDLVNLQTIKFRVLGDYRGRAAWDTLWFYASCKNAVPTGVPLYKQSYASDVGEMILDVPSNLISQFSACPVLYFFYKVEDRSSNLSQFSLVGEVEIIKGDQPIDLLAPDIPAHTARGLLNRAAARDGVFFTANYSGFKSGDQLVYRWGKFTSPIITVTTVPFRINVEWRVLIFNGADSARNNNLPVTYTIFRAGADIASGITSPATMIVEDHTVAGINTHPEAPALLNRLLDLPDIYGGMSNTANSVDSTDINRNLRASFRIFKDPKVGEVASLFFENQTSAATTYTVKPGDFEGKVVDFDKPISWLTFMSGGTMPSTRAYYLTTNFVNDQKSSDRIINVNIIPRVRLSRVVFPGSLEHPNRMLTCATKRKLWEGVEVLINPVQDVLRAGDEIRLTWQGFKNYPDREPLKDVFEIFIFMWRGDSTQTFVVENYNKLIQPLKSFSGAMVMYQVLRNGVIIAESIPGYVQIDRKYAGSGFYCRPDGIGPE